MFIEILESICFIFVLVMSRTNIINISILFILLQFSSVVYGQNERKERLSNILDFCAKKYHVIISYQPKECDNIWMLMPLEEKSLQEVFRKIEKESDMHVGVVDSVNYYIFRRKKQLFTITGRVSDIYTGEAKIGAEIRINNKLVCTTTEHGLYSFVIDSGLIEVIVSYPGYNDKVQTLNIQKGQVYDFNLSPLSFVLDEVVVNENTRTSIISSEAGKILLFLPNDGSVASRMGKKDALSIMETIPGVAPGNIGTGELYVRGGDNGNNGFYIDGAPVYSVNHLYGVNSVFNTNAIDKVEMYKGCIPSRYGNYTGSVTEFYLKNGDMRNHSLELTAGNFISDILLQGPILRDTASYLVSLRYAYPSVYSGILPMGNYANFSFSDLYVKLNIRSKNNSRFFVSCFYAKDRTNLERDNQDNISAGLSDQYIFRNVNLRWDNLMYSFRWNKVFSESFYLNLTSYHSRYLYKASEQQFRKRINSEYSDFNILALGKFRSNIMDSGISLDLRWFPANQHQVRGGLQAYCIDMQPYQYELNRMFLSDIHVYNNSENEIFNSADAIKSNIFKVSLYAEDKVFLRENWWLMYGLRAEFINCDKQGDIHILPFLQTEYRLNKSISFYSGYSKSMQLIRLQPSTLVFYTFASMLWYPPGNNSSPEFNHTFDTSVSFKYEHFRLTNSIYFRYKKNMTLWNLHQRPDGMFYKDFNYKGEGIAWGAELSLQTKIKDSHVALAYSLGYSKDRSVHFYNNKWHEAANDIRHTVNISLNQFFLSGKYEIGGMWSFRTGMPYTLAQIRFILDNDGVLQKMEDYSFRNNTRYTNTHYLNLHLNYHFKLTSQIKSTFSVGVYNAYYHNNPYYAQKKEGGNWGYEEIAMSPIIPYISMTLKI